MHIIAEIWGDEIIVSYGIILEIRRQLTEGPYVGDTVSRFPVVIICDIVEIKHRVMPGRVQIVGCQWAIIPADIFIVSLP